MITVTPAEGPLRKIALTLLHCRLPPDEREGQLTAMLGAVQRGELPLDDLLLALSDGDPVGALLTVRQPGRSALLWPPIVDGPVLAQEISDSLLQAAARRLDEARVLFTQCVLEAEDEPHRAALIRNGFGHAADLLFLRRSLRDPLPPRRTALHSVIFAEPQRDRFARVVERTYEGTMDCPMLRGVRSAAETLVAHQAHGSFDPGRWRVFQAGETDVGVLLMGDYPERDAWEVVYLGVVPEARGQGYGRAMLLDGLDQARRAGTREMLIAVDSKNSYAAGIYENLGFGLTALRAVHLRIGGKR